MRVVVTGVAGFVGSHLAAELLREGHEVVGVDCFLPDSYDPAVKRAALGPLSREASFTFSETDLRTDPLEALLEGADVVINEAAMPGLMRSWTDFPLYVSCNLLAVDRLLQAAEAAEVARFVQISTSSVYGRSAVGDESLPTEPSSPYGVSKLAAEKLVRSHVENFGVNAIVLRYFSLYGPGQRPDMGYHLFCEALLDGRPLTVFGDGRQTRSNTFVTDAVAATVAAMSAGGAGDVLNIAGGERIDLLTAIDVLAEELGVTPEISHRPPRPGDQVDTHGDAGRAFEVLGWRPETPIVEGLRAQARWHRSRRR